MQQRGWVPDKPHLPVIPRNESDEESGVCPPMQEPRSLASLRDDNSLMSNDNCRSLALRGMTPSQSRLYSSEYCSCSSASAGFAVVVNAVIPYSSPFSKAFRFSSRKLGGT